MALLTCYETPARPAKHGLGFSAPNTQPSSPFIAVDDFLRLCGSASWNGSEDSSDSSQSLQAHCRELLELPVLGFDLPWQACPKPVPFAPLTTPSTVPSSRGGRSYGSVLPLHGLATPAAPAHNRAFNNRPAPTAPSTVQQPRQHHTLLARTCAKPSHQPTSSIKGIPSRLGLHKGGVCKKSKPFSGTIMPFQFVKPCGIDGRMTLEVLNAKIQAYDDAAKRASSAPLPPTAGKPPLLKRKASL